MGLLIGALLGALVGLFLAMTNHSAMVAAAQRAGLVRSSPIVQTLLFCGMRIPVTADHEAAPGGGLGGGRESAPAVHTLHANAAPDLP